MAAPGLTQEQQETLQRMRENPMFGNSQFADSYRDRMLEQNKTSYLAGTVSNQSGNNPWLLDAQQLSKNSSYNPDNYFVSGNGVAGGQGIINSLDDKGGMTAEIIQGPGTNLAGNQGAVGKGLGVPGGLNNQETNATTYPTMQNSFGLGTNGATSPQGPGTGIDNIQPLMQAPIPGNQSDPNYAVNKLAQAVGDSGSRGFNPWSTQGEANARNAQ